MIVFSKESWHYRFANFGSMSVKESLCPYVRQVLWGMGVFTVLAAIASWLAISLLLTIACLVTGGYLDALPQWVQIGTSCILAGALAIAGVWLLVTFKNWQDHRRETRPKRQWDTTLNTWVYPPAPEPSLLVEWYRSIHDKICPVIEFKDKEPFRGDDGPSDAGHPWPEVKPDKPWPTE